MLSSKTYLNWGRCRYIESDDFRRARQRRRPRRPAEKIPKLPTETLLLSSQHGLTMCRTQSPSAAETTHSKVTLCYDESVQVEDVSVQKDSSVDAQRALSMLEPHLVPKRFVVTPVNDTCVCPDSSHRHVTVNCIPGPPETSDSVFLASFAEQPATLLSVSLIRMDETDDTTSSLLEQACLKRVLVGCHFIFIENEVTSQIAVPFQGRHIVFRVASVLKIPSKSRISVSILLTTRDRNVFVILTDFILIGKCLVHDNAEYTDHDSGEESAFL